MPQAIAGRSGTGLQLKQTKIGARVVRHACAMTFPLTEAAVTGPVVRTILAADRGPRTADRECFCQACDRDPGPNRTKAAGQVSPTR